jgi:hypothetical protein
MFFFFKILALSLLKILIVEITSSFPLLYVCVIDLYNFGKRKALIYANKSCIEIVKHI